MRRGVDRPGVDLYLFPAVIGHGRGDVEEVLALGRALDRSGFFPILFRSGGRPLPAGVDSTFEWPRHLRRSNRPLAHHPRAAVIASWWGVTSAPPSAGPLGNPGPWAEEWAELERAYGREHLLGISVEEFARTLSDRQQVSERWREGGWPSARIARHLASPAGRAEVKTFHRLYRRFRAFGTPNVLHLFPTLGPSRGFAHAHPAAIQVGPIRSGFSLGKSGAIGGRRETWIWHASPASSVTLVSGLRDGLQTREKELRVLVGAPPGSPLRSLGPPFLRVNGKSATSWKRQFQAASVRIVTGGRSLVEALELRRPFLYFNGTLGTGLRRRRHRPEKIRALLRMWQARGVAPEFLRDLGDFSRGRRIGPVVRRAAQRAWQRRFPRLGLEGIFFPHPYDDPATLIQMWLERWARDPQSASMLVREERASARRVFRRG